MENKFVDPISYVVGCVTLFIGFFLFYSDTGEPIGSLFAAILAGALAWVSYVLVRWLVLALKG